jgi:hypothetical protein
MRKCLSETKKRLSGGKQIMALQENGGSENQSGKLLRFKLYGIEEHFQICYSPDLALEVYLKLKASFDLRNDIQEQSNSLIEWLTSTIVWWNYEDDNGSSVPITTENIKGLPYLLVMEMLNAIIADLRQTGAV